VVDFSMALLSFADSAPRAYWLKAGNPYLTFSTSTGTSPCGGGGAATAHPGDEEEPQFTYEKRDRPKTEEIPPEPKAS